MSAAVALSEIPEQTAPSPRPRITVNEIVLYGLTALLMFSPLAFGAVEPWAVFVLESVSAILFVIWIGGQMRSPQITVRWSPIFPPMLVFVGLACIQMLPRLSAYRHATSTSLLLYFAYGILCFLITQTLTRTRHIRTVATAAAIFGVWVALFAILQSLSSTRKLYWVRTPRFGGWIYGPYVNHNHYAGLMEMLMPVPLVFAFSRYAHGRERWAAAGAASLMAGTVFLSGSRGGMAAFTVQLGVFFWLLFRERRRERTAFLLGVFLLISLAMVAWIGGSQVSDRIITLDHNHRAELTSDIRLRMDRDAIHMFSKRPLLGWGLGTFEAVYPQFRSFYTSLLVDKTHNDYLQLLVETGVLGFAVAIWFLWVTFQSACRKTHRWPSDVNGSVRVAVIIGISGILVHSLVDFNLQIPANAAIFYVLCTIASLEPSFGVYRRDHTKSRTE